MKEYKKIKEKRQQHQENSGGSGNNSVRGEIKARKEEEDFLQIYRSRADRRKLRKKGQEIRHKITPRE
jgi:hypothetical protein